MYCSNTHCFSHTLIRNVMVCKTFNSIRRFVWQWRHIRYYITQHGLYDAIVMEVKSELTKLLWTSDGQIIPKGRLTNAVRAFAAILNAPFTYGNNIQVRDTECCLPGVRKSKTIDYHVYPTRIPLANRLIK